MFNQNHSIVAFLKETSDGVSFPFLPEQICDDGYDIYFINYDTFSPNTDVMDQESKLIRIPYNDIEKYGGVANIVASMIHSEGREQRRLFTIHPNNVLLPIYKWYLLSHGTDISSVDQNVQRLSRLTVDICEAFHKPTILTLDRRQNFNYKTIARWMNLSLKPGAEIDNCLSTLRYICHRL